MDTEVTHPSCREFLREEFSRRSRANARYSIRAFAKHLGLSPGEVSEILAGKRKLTPKAAFKIAKKLGLSPEETHRLIVRSQLDRAGVTAPVTAPAREERMLSLDAFRVVSDWWCFAILNLADTKGFRWDAIWISRRLGIGKLEAEDAIERLERVGLIEKTARGGFRVCADFVLSTDGVPSEAIRKAHRELLDKAIAALELQSVHERDISGIGFATHPRHLPALKRDIAKFQDQIVRKYSQGERTEVMHLEMALFRLTEGKT